MDRGNFQIFEPIKRSGRQPMCLTTSLGAAPAAAVVDTLQRVFGADAGLRANYLRPLHFGLLPRNAWDAVSRGERRLDLLTDNGVPFCVCTHKANGDATRPSPVPPL